MNVRLFLLLAVAAGLAVYFVMKPSKRPKSGNGQVQAVELDPPSDPMPGELRARVEEMQKDLWTLPLPGSEPADPPRFAVTVTPNPASGKNQLCFDISEAHGYFVETLVIEFWHTGPDGKATLEDSPLGLQETINDYIEVDKTLHVCMEVVPVEFERIKNTLGTSENWKAQIVKYNRARVKNPDPLWPHPTRLPKVQGRKGKP